MYRQNIKTENKDILELKNPMDEMDLTDIYKVFHSTTTVYSQQPMELSPKYHNLGHRVNPPKYKKLKKMFI
jgi:hypothetical protein